MIEHVSKTINPNNVKDLIEYLKTDENLGFLLIIGISRYATRGELASMCQLIVNMEQRNTLPFLYLTNPKEKSEKPFAIILPNGRCSGVMEIISMLKSYDMNLFPLSRDEERLCDDYFYKGHLTSSVIVVCPSRLVPFIRASSDYELWLSAENVNEYNASREQSISKFHQAIEGRGDEVPFSLNSVQKKELERVKDDAIQQFREQTSLGNTFLDCRAMESFPSLILLQRKERPEYTLSKALYQLDYSIHYIIRQHSLEINELKKSQTAESIVYHSHPRLDHCVYCQERKPISPSGQGVSELPKVKRFTFVPLHDDVTNGPLADGRQQIDSAVFAPMEAKRGYAMMVQVFIYTELEKEKVFAKAKKVDKDAEIRNYTALDMSLKKGDHVEVDFSLTDKSLEIDEPIQTLCWMGHFTSAEFCVLIPKKYWRSTLVGKVLLSVNGLPVGTMKFVTMLVEKPSVLHAPVSINRFRKVFMSYSHLDTLRVASMAEGFRMMGSVDYFFDRHTLKTGEDYEKSIEEFIRSSDAFVLFWSKNAASSAWVTKEYTWALQQREKKGADEFSIHPLHIAPHADPPKALCRLHFSELQFPVKRNSIKYHNNSVLRVVSKVYDCLKSTFSIK